MTGKGCNSYKLVALLVKFEYSDCISLRRGKNPHSRKKKCPDTKLHLVVSVQCPVLEIWGVWSSPSLPLLPGSLWVVVPVCVSFMGQVGQFRNYLQLIGLCVKKDLLENYLYSIGILETIRVWAKYLYLMGILDII